MENISSTNIKHLLIYAKKNKDDINIIMNYYVPTSGYLYCIHNEIYNYYGDDVYKFGNSSDPDKRCSQYTTPYVKPCTIIKISNNYFDKNFAETLLFYYLREYRLVENREFFKCDKEIYEKAFIEVDNFFKLHNTPQSLFNYFINNVDVPILCLNIDNTYRNKKKHNDKEKLIENILNENIINEYLKDNKEHKILDNKYDGVISFIKYFNLEEEDLYVYKSIFTNKLVLEHYFNFIKLLKKNNKIIQINELLEFNNYKITISDKINIIKYIYDKHEIKYLSLNDFNKIKKINITEQELKIIQYNFRTRKENPTNIHDFKIFLVSMIKHIIKNLKIIDIKINMDKYKNIFYLHSWNINNISFFLNLYNKKKGTDKNNLVKIT
jgi:hypothetical protein